MPTNIQPRWRVVEYSRNQIIKAGKTIRKENTTPEEIREATSIIDNWRAAHAFPLHIIYMHLRRMAACRNDIIVAERLKRLDSIIGKLKREPSMSLWNMQDLGGCRFIVPTCEDVVKYSEQFMNSRMRHKFINSYDYIEYPKRSGYRSKHIVIEYKSDTIETYNKNMLIEIQFRTHLQHVWATAVETMGLFTMQAIKSGQGNADVQRFFALISSFFAIREGKPTIPGTPDDIECIKTEIQEIDKRCNFLDMLSAIRVAVDHEPSGIIDKKGYYILILNYKTRRLQIKYFKPSEADKANSVYSEIEESRHTSQIDAVLVRVSSFSILKAAYPNYFSDIGEFVDLVIGLAYNG